MYVLGRSTLDKPFPAYRGDAPYVFVCYAHEDEDVVYPEIGWLYKQGIHLWYDEGISAGKVWRAEIAAAIQDCSKVLYYISAASLSSEHCNREVDYALDKGSEIVPVYLEDVDLTPELDLALNRVQALYRDRGASHQQRLMNVLGQTVEAAQSPRQKPKFPSDKEATSILTIAVLPFDNLSGDTEQEYFVDGMTEDLITRLSAFRGAQVIARNSSFVYKGRAVDVKQVSRELGARYVVEGSVRKSGDRVRISAQLTDATTGHIIWTSNYDRGLRDVFALQDEISQTIVGSIFPQLVAFEGKRMMHRNPQSLDAYENALRGWWHANQFTREDNASARSFFERAIELGSNYARAFAGIAVTHFTDSFLGWSDSPTHSHAEFGRFAQRAVALDPRDPICVVTLGYYHTTTGQADEAIAAFEQAIQLNPSDVGAHHGLGVSLLFAGRPDEAIASLKTAMRLSPHDPNFLGNVGFAHFAAERYEDAIEWTKRSMRGSHIKMGWGVAASSYAHLGRLDDARTTLQQLTRHEPDWTLADAARLVLDGANPSLRERYLDGLRKAGMK